MSQSNVKTYFLVFGALGILTGLTVILSYLNISEGKGIVLASLIALTKVSLIGAFFMHLKDEGKGIYALMFTAVFFVAVLILAIIPDIGLIK